MDGLDECFRMEPWYDFKLLTTIGIFMSGCTYFTTPQQYRISKEKKTHVKEYRMTYGEIALFSTLIICTLLNIYIRVAKGVPHWLLQPCHILSFILIYIMYTAGKDTRYFYSYYYSMWMPLVGLVSTPNENWFLWWWERPVFYVHHTILLVIPYYYLIFNHRFHGHLKKGKEHVSLLPHFSSKLQRFKLFAHTFGYGIIYHAFGLGLLGLLLEEDFDSMRCRFDGGEIFGVYWREALVLVTFLGSFVISFIPDFIIHKVYNAKFLALNNNNNNYNNVKNINNSNITSKKQKSN